MVMLTRAAPALHCLCHKLQQAVGSQPGGQRVQLLKALHHLLLHINVHQQQPPCQGHKVLLLKVLGGRQPDTYTAARAAQYTQGRGSYLNSCNASEDICLQVCESLC